jgi:hypothetical protein
MSKLPQGALGELLGRIGLMWLDKRPLSKDSRRDRRIRKGKCICEVELADDYCPMHGTKQLSPNEERTMILQGKVTHTGAGIAASSPFVGLLVNAFVPSVEQAIVNIGMAPVVCAPEVTSCVTAGQMAFALITGFVAMAGGAIASYGRKRAETRHAAELAAAQAKQ